ncbi:MAG: phage antirepressor KilAC domain-containing protein [Parafilimonas terrae]|nr:phage antirepressor KilAC domain-containing protein [Parafilimonas terrae]
MRTPGGYQSVTIVSEPGFYQAVLSRKPTARAMPGMVERIERFQDWIVEEVLPTIRKTGAYVVPGAAPPAPFDPLAMLQDVDVLIPLLATMAQRVKTAEAAVEAARPAVAFVEALADSDGLWGLRAAGKALHQGPDKFILWLRDRGDLYDLNGGPVPKQDLINRKLYQVAWAEHGGKPRPTTKITGRGMVYYAKALGVRPPGAPAQALLPGL